MKRWLFVFSLIGLFFFITVAFVSSQIGFPLIAPVSPGISHRYYDYSGITHVHSRLSTGSGSLNDITRVAYKAGCNFLIVTDLNQVVRPQNIEGYRDEVLVIWGGEY